MILCAGGFIPASPDSIPNGRIILQEPDTGQQTKGKHVIIHNNYITGFEKKIKRFREYVL